MKNERTSDELNRRNTAFDNRLRPVQFEEFVGQRKIRDRLELAVKAAKDRGETLDHVLFSGPPGLGKTTLSYILGDSMGVHVKTTSGPVLTKPGDLAGLLTSLDPGDIVFIDEIHRMAKTVEEYLYSAMEDFAIDIMIDQGPNARSVRLELPRFTLVGATTRIGLIAAPLRARFHSSYRSPARRELWRTAIFSPKWEVNILNSCGVRTISGTSTRALRPWASISWIRRM